MGGHVIRYDTLLCRCCKYVVNYSITELCFSTKAQTMKVYEGALLEILIVKFRTKDSQ